MPEVPRKIDVRQMLTAELMVHSNVNQEIVVTTVDKLRLCLMRNYAHLTAKTAWTTPLGVLLTLAATLCAAEFRDTLGIKKEYWWALFMLAAASAAAWLVASLYRLVRAAIHGYRKGSQDT